MPSSRNRSIEHAAKSSRMVDYAREIAEIGDQWFLSVAAGIGRAGGWARREADIVADSAVAAFATTMTVAKKLTSLAAAGLEPTEAPRSREDGEPDDDERSSSGPEIALDLISTVRPDDVKTLDRVGASTAERLGVERDSLTSPNPAGVVPLLQALGRTVAKHTQAGYTSLQEDPRFWTLVHLVQALGRPTITSSLPEADCADCLAEDDGVASRFEGKASRSQDPQLASLPQL